MDDYYKILDVSREASEEEIKKAYRKLAKQLHPDRHPRSKNWKQYYEGMFIKVTEAYSVLSDREKREQYNGRLNQVNRSPLEDNKKKQGKDSRRSYSYNRMRTVKRRVRNIIEELIFEPKRSNSKSDLINKSRKKITAIRSKIQPSINKVINLIYKDSD